jgi:hypothetical protein
LIIENEILQKEKVIPIKINQYYNESNSSNETLITFDEFKFLKEENMNLNLKYNIQFLTNSLQTSFIEKLK